jgi:glycogen phosphorylase
VTWKQKIRAAWSRVKVESVTPESEHLAAGQSAGVTTTVRLGGLAPADVSVQLYAGPIDADRNLLKATPTALTVAENLGDGVWRYAGTLPSNVSGRLGFSVRVLPAHPDAVLPQELPLIAWE